MFTKSLILLACLAVGMVGLAGCVSSSSGSFKAGVAGKEKPMTYQVHRVAQTHHHRRQLGQARLAGD